jgi:hypothetical protein
LALLLLAQSASAETFRHSGGFFRKEGNLWVEYPAHNAAGFHFTFEEIFRNATRVVLYDRSRAFLIRIPARGGTSAWTTLDRNGWMRYHDMTREP